MNAAQSADFTGKWFMGTIRANENTDNILCGRRSATSVTVREANKTQLLNLTCQIGFFAFYDEAILLSGAG